MEDLFHLASDMAPSERDAYLSQACGADVELRAEVESLLESADKTLGFLRQPIHKAAEEISQGAPLTGVRIGAYEVMKELGEGGMGKVYLAARADDQYQRLVAIKLMHGVFRQSPAMLLRFRAERQILATLDHPNIARLLDGGVTAEGSPYLVMEFVDGKGVDEFCRERQLSTAARLRLFRIICSAVDYAHHNLVVHRDIKPANILVTPQGVPKLLDFGIAKLLDPDLSDQPLAKTRATERLMTPEYASPEQIRGEQVTTATDVYGLGVLLYELLAGKRPFRARTNSPLETAREICESEPPPPSAASLDDPGLAPPDARTALKADLDNIVLMAMRKEPTRRYASVAQFSADITAYLDGYPLVARTSTWSYRTTRFIGRHKGSIALAVFMVIALIGFSIGMGVLAHRATRERLKAEREARFLTDMFQAATPEQARGRTITAHDLLDLGAERVDKELASEPAVRASLLDTISGAYRSLGIYGEGKEVAERAFNLKLQTLGPNNPSTVDTLYLLANLIRLKGEFQKAEPLFRQVVTLRTKILGVNDPALAESLGALGECLYLEDKNAEAEPPLRQALAIDRQNSPNLGSDVRNYLALLLERKGDYAEAAQLLREALEIESRKGTDTPEYAIALHNLASDLIDLGDLAGAEQKLRETLAIRRKVLGNDHPMLFYTLNNLGYVLLEKGDWQAAEPFLQESLALNLRTNGEKHPSMASSLNNWGRVLHAKGDYTQAEVYFRKGLDTLARANASESWAYAQIVGNLGLLAFDQRHYEAAEDLARQSLALRRRLSGEETPALASALIDLAEDRLFQRDPQSAEPMLREALKIRQKKYTPKHPLIISAQVRLGETLAAEGKTAEAETVSSDALNSARTAPFPLYPWQIAEVESVVAALHHSKDSATALAGHPRPAFREPAAARLAHLAQQN